MGDKRDTESCLSPFFYSVGTRGIPDLQQGGDVNGVLLLQIVQQQQRNLWKLDAQIFQCVGLDERIDVRILVIDNGFHRNTILLGSKQTEQGVIDTAQSLSRKSVPSIVFIFRQQK